MKESKSIFQEVINASVEAAIVTDTNAVKEDPVVCENLIGIFKKMHLSIDNETAKAIWIFYSMTHQKCAWAENGKSEDVCFRAVLEMAYIFFKPDTTGQFSLNELTPEDITELTSSKSDFGSLFQNILEMNEEQQQFMFLYFEQLAGKFH